MDVLYARCAGLDVHQKTVVACVLTPGHREVRTFGTMTDDLLALGDWLDQNAVTDVVLESTGVLWKPVFNLLEDRCTLWLVNARHVKQVPGRKTDVRDCEWLADLLRHGLVRASFVPERPQRELRELTRYRTSVVRERATVVNRLQKVLEGANIKLSAVATDVLGRSGRAILEALVAGDAAPTEMADLARGRLRAKRPTLARALAGSFGPHQRFLVAQQLAHIDFLDEVLVELSAEIAARVAAEEAAIQRLDAIPGIARRTAEILVAEIGVDMARFPSAAHLASWAGLCPGNHESAGKRQSGQTRRGNPWLRTTLVEAAHAAAHTKDTYLGSQFRRLAARRGPKRAAVAVAHSILVIVYHLLRHGTTYQDLGGDYLASRTPPASADQLVRRLEGLGYHVTLQPVAPPAAAA